ncbi:MAG: uncharacterized protein K0R66_237 [Gammaproteobacteria bacterium]|jgi:hypothetical protein|nr:uncharacterized protein [Gammaproteobacteria bacterium]
MIDKIVSGGQTGVDRAALDVAIGLNIPHGGWCPKGRLAEDGSLSDRYHLKETQTSDYSERTKLNIQDSDATLVLVPALPLNIQDGTVLTIEELKAKAKPHLIIDLSQKPDQALVLKWIKEHHIKTLNVAGPRESTSPGIYQKASEILNHIFA